MNYTFIKTVLVLTILSFWMLSCKKENLSGGAKVPESKIQKPTTLMDKMIGEWDSNDTKDLSKGYPPYKTISKINDNQYKIVTVNPASGSFEEIISILSQDDKSILFKTYKQNGKLSSFKSKFEYNPSTGNVIYTPVIGGIIVPMTKRN